MRTDNAGPPEYRFENLVVFLQLDQGGSGKVEVEVRIPAGNFRGPGIIGIAQVRAKDGELGKAAGYVIERGGPHTVDADVGRDFRMRAHDDAAVEQQNHPVLFGPLVYWPVAFVVVVLERAAHLTQAAKSGGVEAVHQRNSLRVIQLDGTESDETLGMLLDERLYILEVLRLGQQEGCAVVFV